MKARVRQSKNKQSLSKEQTKKIIMKNKIARLKATNEKLKDMRNRIDDDLFEINIEEELNHIEDDEFYNTDLTNFKFKL